MAAGATVALIVGMLLTGCAAGPAAEAPAADGSQNSGPTPTATVPAPGGGTVDDVVVDGDDQPAVPADPDPTPLDQPAELDGGIVVVVADAERVETKAETPGEVAGPAVAVRLKITNGTDSTVDLSTVMVSLTGDEGAFGQPTTSAPAAPFSGELAAGADAEGVYVFGLPAEQRDDLSIRVEYVAGAPLALFVGQI
jgi:hypothetical protein